MGINGSPISEQLSETLDIEHGGGVTKVLPDNPTKLVSIQPFTTATNQGNVIVTIDDVPIHSGCDMVTYFNKIRPGDDVKIYVVRNKNNLKLKVDLGEWPDA